MRWLKPLAALGATLALFYLLHFKQGQIPPLGKFLNPFAGFWQNNTTRDEILSDLILPELLDTVQVLWDDRRVPHIFARNNHDLYFAQGYLTAADRLWQMEFQTHAAAGRLSEIVGARALEYDRFRRRIGMVYAAENAMKAMRENPATLLAVEAYTNGVNAWIRGLEAKRLPFEYKILDYQPEPWTVLKSAILLKFMAWRLTSRNHEIIMSRTRATLGDSLTRVLHPDYPPFMEPIIPAGTRWDFSPHAVKKPQHDFKMMLRDSAQSKEDFSAQGSNNWAVAGARTASGYPMLCNDPHLTLNLPAIWYEIQLVSPEVNVYGVSLPGAPAVIIGFNQQVAWGVTNSESDVMDWYHLTFKDSTQQQYFYDGAWRATQRRVEEIKIRGGEAVRDTIFYTHHGPVVYRNSEKPYDWDIPSGAALRWVAHDSSNELATFMYLNRARSYDDYLSALSFYASPAQNFVFADSSGNIALWHQGRFPLRWEKQGQYLSDGSDPAYDWQGWVPLAQNPHVKNPARGFVSSANQNPVDTNYPYYLGSNYAIFERGGRINAKLAEMKNIAPEDMIALHNDVMNLHARNVLLALLAQLALENFSPDEARAYEELMKWNYENHASAIAPSIFEYWWQDFMDLVWNDELASAYGAIKRPRRDVTVDLILRQPHARYFDMRDTARRETLRDMAALSLRSALRKLTEKWGPVGPAWEWGRTRGTDILHLANIPGMGRRNLLTSGNYTCVNATTKTTGPSWRMVVAFGPHVKAWGIYPGGQSGNPGSRFYDNFVDDWVAGKTYDIPYLNSPNATDDRIVGKTILRSAL